MNFCELGLSVIETEAQAVFELGRNLDLRFNRACEILLSCKGRIVVTGMGKSGHIGGKIAATLASTGSPAFFMHPGEANHGDLGMLTRDDVVLAISYSGATQEIVSLLPIMKRLGVPLIAMTGSPDSPIANLANVHLDIGVTQEACPLGLAPTTSTTVSLVLGDALAIALLKARGFSVEDFARSHPGGSLGKRLLLKIDDLWHADDYLPCIIESASIREALIVVTAKKLGMTCVVDHLGQLMGIFTDGDVRRCLTQDIDIKTTALSEIITRNPHTVTPGMLAAEALSLMQKHKITSLAVIDTQNRPLAVVHLHDLLRAGVI